MAASFLFDPERNASNRLDFCHDPYMISTANLHFKLDKENTEVRNVITVERNPVVTEPRDVGGPLILDGEGLKLKSLRILENGRWRDLGRQEFAVDKEKLTIRRPPEGPFSLEIVTNTNPTANTKMTGLYAAGKGILSTQCEPRGFRCITYFLDHPDNLSVFTTTLEADKKEYPTLLSNGSDHTKTKDIGGGRHSLTCTDSIPKPSYLFAIAAGELKVQESTFKTMSGREVKVNIFVQPGYEDKIDWAMGSVKRAMKWDEEKYGHEYKLDVFNILAVDGFNMGAMENKGLNIFNVAALVGDPRITTDAGLEQIEDTVAHEYFHDATGDTVTLRDWFELTLKEGLTVLRHRQHGADQHSSALRTIKDAVDLRSHQFMEDSGPSSLPIRPDHVEEFNNIYSGTTYEKGSHVLGMIHTLLGPAAWRRGMDAYFEKFSGKAVTCEDFVKNMEETSGVDLKQFRQWYSQSGTPEITYDGVYDSKAKTYSLKLTQNTPATADQTQDEKKNLHIPIAVGLIGQSGKDVPLTLAGESGEGATTRVLNLTEKEQAFVFRNVPGTVVPSVLRGFSAPVKIVTQPSDEELVFRMAHDSDPYNRYEAKNNLMLNTLYGLIKDVQDGKSLELRKGFLDAYTTNVANALDGDKAFSAMMLSFPEYNILIQGMKTVDPDAIHKATKFMEKTLAAKFKDDFERIYKATTAPAGEVYDTGLGQVGRRELHNLSLSFLGKLDTPESAAKAEKQYLESWNMTEKQAALVTLSRMESKAGRRAATAAFADFYQTFKDTNNVIDRWFQIQAGIPGEDAADRVRDMKKHEAFDIKNPNKVRYLMGGFANGNPTAFHKKDGSGYKLLADVVIELNGLNPQIGAMLVNPLMQFKRYDEERQALTLKELKRIMDTPKLDSGIKELVGKALDSAEPKPPENVVGNKFKKAAIKP
ncbi:MAG: aminopeptidase N [Pseudomonadota bacterium]